MTEQTTVTQGPAAAAPTKTVCCGDPTNRNANKHPWILISDTGPGDVYHCPDCGAVDVD